MESSDKEHVKTTLFAGGEWLFVPEQRSDCVRATFCQQSLLFQSEEVASTFLVAHPEALLLSVEEAAYVGRLVAEMRFTEKHDVRE